MRLRRALGLVSLAAAGVSACAATRTTPQTARQTTTRTTIRASGPPSAVLAVCQAGASPANRHLCPGLVQFAVDQARTHHCSSQYADAYVAETAAVGLRLSPSTSFFQGCAPVGAPTPSPAGVALGMTVIDSPGPGWRHLADEPPTRGPLDATEAVAPFRADLQVGFFRVLAADGFIAGYARSWTSGGELLTIICYQFRDAAAAASYVAPVSPGQPASDVRAVSLPGIPGGHGGVATSASGGAYLAVVVFSRGPLAFTVQLRSDHPLLDPATLTSAASAQYRHP